LNSLQDEFSQNIFVLLDDWPRFADQLDISGRWNGLGAASLHIQTAHLTIFDGNGSSGALENMSCIRRVKRVSFSQLHLSFVVIEGITMIGIIYFQSKNLMIFTKANTARLTRMIDFIIF